MKHFVMQEWVDFVRGVIPQQQNLAMQKHLDSGCSNCRNLVETWKHVLDCAEREKSYEPPDAYVRMAKVHFAQNPPEQAGSREISCAELVFDSFAQPVAQGVRSSGSRARQLVFRKGNYSIDMRIEPHGSRLAIVGQVLDSGQANSGIGEIPVRLLAYKQHTTTSRFGEFQFEVERLENLELLFVMSEERDLMIAIPISQGPASGPPGVTVFLDESRKM